MSVSQASTAQTYEANVDLVDDVLTHYCRRHFMSAAEQEDFCQEVHLKLLETRRIEQFRGECTLRTFLTIVIKNLHQDIRDKNWGKWRPSVHARKHGKTAELLEQLVVRDGFTFEEALEKLRTDHKVTVSRRELEAIVARLPFRVNRKPQSDDVLVNMPAGGLLPDALLSREEYEERAAQLREVLEAALRELDPNDRLMVEYRFFEGLPLVKIARLMKIEQKEFYRYFEDILKRLRRYFEDKGIDSAGLFDDDELVG